MYDSEAMKLSLIGGWLTFDFNAGTTATEPAAPFAVFERCAFRPLMAVGFPFVQAWQLSKVQATGRVLDFFGFESPDFHSFRVTSDVVPAIKVA